jgi:hypothetical protein
MVELGRDVPSWGLNRWGGLGLRFLPPDDEGFTLRGDNRRLVYKGRRRSHRFTILGDTAFEYDCILEKEPENNIIVLHMEGAEKFDFFRQPEFIKNPLLAGSYAVYKKETLIGEGTGKLCHIHRPEIIDSRGRRCRGDLSIAGNELRITIPENFLSEAKYPVIVDPVIGLSALGALGPEDEGESENSYWGFNDWSGMALSRNMGVNQFTAPHPVTGNCTAHLYVDYYPGGYHWSTTQDKVWPVLYTHDPVKDRPGIIKSGNGGYISNDVGRSAGPPRGWRSTDITVDGSIQQGQVFWFGFLFWNMEPRYDYGGRLYRCNASPYQSTYAGLRQKFYQYPMDIEYDSYEDEAGNEIEYELWVEPSYDLKISMYLEYAGPPANYTRTLTQGVTLADIRKPIGAYKRSATQTVRGTGVVKGLAGFYRTVIQTVTSTMALKRYPTLIRNLVQAAGAGDGLGRLWSMLRKPLETAGAADETQRISHAKRTIADTGKPGTAVDRQQDFKRSIAHGGGTESGVLRNAGYVKRLQDTAGSTANAGIIRALLLKLTEAAAALYEMKSGAGFNRGITDAVSNHSIMSGTAIFFRTLFGSAGGGDSPGRFISLMRIIQDTGTAGDDTGHTTDYLRGLFVEAGNIAETTRRGEYYRKQQDTAFSGAVPLRHLFIFIRLLTGAYIRDYIIGRFLKSKEEVVIKSPVCREITIESTLH